ncbi:MAG: ribonuclease H-like domain-containing protein [Thermoflavifilum sp.]|nr:ribonuclease H-like domain-containing protein [Thermoflavifilum sp.]MCL6514196.1 ribonuclease H-like domain-containing protein [Alicyclobacillus sp.]
MALFFCLSGFLITQFLLADHAEEPALLHTLAARLTPGEVWVSFNGRAFDWPLLKSRMRLHRLHDDPARPQLDLLHPARRLWRSRLDRVSLQTVEAEVLGMRRTADLPGSEAPDRYFRFVEDPQAECLAPVLDHNASDVLTLVVLATEVAARMGAPTADSAAEFAAMGRWYDEWQVYDLADACFERAAQHPDADWQSLWLASLHWKRRREWHRAAAIWRELAQRYPGSVAPLVELAKWAEHQLRQWDEAERWTMEALARAERQVRERLRSVGAVRSSAHAPADIGGRAAVEADPLVRALRHRLARIRRKRADRQG